MIAKKMGSAAASGTAAQPSAGTNSDVITSQHLMDAGDCDLDGAGDNILATRISDHKKWLRTESFHRSQRFLQEEGKLFWKWAGKANRKYNKSTAWGSNT